MLEKLKNGYRKIRTLMTPDEMFHENEVQANRLGFLILAISLFFLVLILVLCAVGVFPLTFETMGPPTIPAIIEIAVLLVICLIVKHDAWWLKPLLMIGIVIVYARLDSLLTHKAALLMILPVVFSSRYFSRRLTIFTSVLTSLAFGFSAAWGATHGLINLNIVEMEAGTVMTATGGFLGEAVQNAGGAGFNAMLTRNTLVYDYLPKWMIFSIVSVISCNIARRGRNMVKAQHEKDVKTARIEYELNLASRIQSDMLPNTFPAFPDRAEFDIYASMDPAKEVGGDFYDHFPLDNTHYALMIADVSGKGVPAALFMMASRIVLANNAKAGKSPAKILEDTNASICAHNREEMFVTVWLGILEISTGRLTAASAGHEYPVIRHADGAYEILKDRHGFVVGGMEGAKYKDYEVTLEPGSRLFVYTDGVPEATDAQGGMFGMERMVETLNRDPSAHPEQVLKAMRASVDEFVKDAEQFDDLTMLCLEYRGEKHE